MTTFDVAETFTSINGEGTHAGQLAVFVRFCGCNLQCSFCDTSWANEPNAPHVCQTTEEICAAVDATGVNNITLTGGEPLLRDGMTELLTALSQKENRYIEIETNGSVDLTPFVGISPALPSRWITSCRAAVWKRTCVQRIFPCFAHRTP